MANIFRNPLVLAENAVGSMIDQRSVILYEQPDLQNTRSELYNKITGIYESIGEALSGTILYPTVEDWVKKRQLKELFTGQEMPVLSDINGWNAWGISYMDAELDITSDICEHPIENGTKITDTTVKNPITAHVNIVMPTAFYSNIFQDIVKHYEERTKIILLTKLGVYENMIISRMPYKLQHNDIDRPTINLELRQIMEVAPEYEYVQGNGIGAITQNKARVYDDTSRVDVGRIHTDAVSRVIAEG